jgi:tetratricopeptide (TPR) repeat protein
MNSASRWMGCLLLGVLLAAGVPAGLAQPPERSDAETLRLLQERQRVSEEWRGLFGKGQYKQALAPCQRTLALDEELFGAEHSQTAGSHNDLAVVLFELGDYSGARQHYEQAAEIYVKAHGEAHRDTARAYHNLGILCNQLGDYSTARKLHEKALAIRRQVLGEGHPETADSYDKFGHLLMELSEYGLAQSGCCSVRMARCGSPLGRRCLSARASCSWRISRSAIWFPGATCWPPRRR